MVPLELATPTIPVRLTELLALQPGSVLTLRRSAQEAAVLQMGGRHWWSARPVSSRNFRAAQLGQQLIQEEEG